MSKYYILKSSYSKMSNLTFVLFSNSKHQGKNMCIDCCTRHMLNGRANRKETLCKSSHAKTDRSSSKKIIPS